MITRLFILLIAVSLSACGDAKKNADDVKINIDDADVSIPNNIKMVRIEFKTLNTEVREALQAGPNALIAVIADSGVTVYGVPDKTFRFIPKDQVEQELAKVDGKDPVNDLVVKTFVSSPECHFFLDDTGNGFWYPVGCPH
ncbi:MAG: hypothetical protein HKP12_07170 [Gammaproteobacteria bacterium]|nr:hypothetical protein [Gammaproteobacteria bacterium]